MDLFICLPGHHSPRTHRGASGISVQSGMKSAKFFDIGKVTRCRDRPSQFGMLAAEGSSA